MSLLAGLTTRSCRLALGGVFLSALAGSGAPAVVRGNARLAARPAALVSCRGGLVPAHRLEETSRLLELRSPREHELNGETFSVVVAGYALSPCVPGAAGRGLAAPAGDDVAVVSVIVEQSGTSRLSPELALVAGGKTFRLPAGAGGAATYALAVPKGSGVLLEAREAGLTQSFSLQSGALSGDVPEALYRSRLGPLLVQAPDRAVTFEVVDAGHREFFRVLLATVELGDFSPSGRPAPARSGFLTVGLLDGAPASVPDWLRELPASRVRLVLTDPPGGVVEARPVFNELGGDFAFLVPAGVVRAVLEVTPGTLAVGGRTVQVLGTGRLPIVLPAPPRWLRALVAGGARAAAPSRPRGGLPAPVVVLVAGGGSSLVIVPLLVFIPWRRRRQKKKGPYALAAGGEMLGRGPAASSRPPVPAPGAGAVAPAAEPALPPGLGFRVLGPVEVLGLELPVKRPVALELLCFLALESGRRFSAGDIICELWPLREDGREQVSIETFRSYVSAARTAAGEAALPKNDSGTYRIGEGVWTDWAIFSELTGRAARLDAALARPLLAEALSLVRGMPFSEVPEGRYGWAVTSGLAEEMRCAITQAACRLCDLSLEEGCPGEALSLLRVALSATKADEVGDDLVTLAGATGSIAEVDSAWREVVAAGCDVARLEKNYRAIRKRLLEEDDESG